MNLLTVTGVTLRGVVACVPPRKVDNREALLALHQGDAAKADSVVQATGIRYRREAEPGTTVLDLFRVAAHRLLEKLAAREGCGVAERAGQIGGVVAVSFTSPFQMPCLATQMQSALGLAKDIPAFDVAQACAGYPYGLYLAGQLARATGKGILLLDGDVQTAQRRADDPATVPVLSDAAAASWIEPDAGALPWHFAFRTDGAQGAALQLPRGGTIAMDGFGVFKFVAADVARFLEEFLRIVPPVQRPQVFVPHQANVYMVRQLAKKLGFASEQVWISGDEYGNPASASVPLTLVHAASTERSARLNLCLAGYGGGLAASAAALPLEPTCVLDLCDLSAS